MVVWVDDLQVWLNGGLFGPQCLPLCQRHVGRIILRPCGHHSSRFITHVDQ
eukprot:COSAG02_NODE_30841_length_544_cov_1.008989_2_plen_50_part_01